MHAEMQRVCLPVLLWKLLILILQQQGFLQAPLVSAMLTAETLPAAEYEHHMHERQCESCRRGQVGGSMQYTVHG